MSPTYSQMINTISLDDEEFEINKELLRNDFYYEANKERRVWFFSKVPKDIRTLYQEKFYRYLREEKKNIKYWIWFKLFKQEECPDYPGKRVNNTSTKTKIWKTSDDTVIESIHPPEANIEKNINETIVKASPFKTKPENKGTDSIVDVRKIMEHNNYTNMFLKTLGDQLNRVKEIIETQDHIKTLFVKKDNKPLFKSFEFSKKFQENPHIDQSFINQKVKDSLIVHETPQPSHKRINVIKEEISFEAEANELIKIFEESPDQKVLRIIHNHETPKTRNYYPRPTFPDMQYEERNQYTQASYTSGTIYEWNIDGMTEYNILTKLQEMTMVSTTYKLNNRLSDHVVAQTIVVGFTGQLKGWWDNYLTFNDRNGILKAYRINE